MFKPLFILTPTGRTGTTLIMALLNLSRSIVLDQVYPYETRLLQEKARAPSDSNRFSEPEPYSYYKHLARHQQKDAHYIAEKLIGLDHIAMDSAYEGARFLFTVRDPRDVLISIKAFDRKRGYHGFALQDEDDLITSVRKIGGAFAELAALQLDSSKLLVRYEDLVHNQKATLDSLTEWLKLKPASFVDAPVHEHHRTCSLDGSQIERWRTEMTKDILDVCNHHWKPIIEHFGYDL